MTEPWMSWYTPGIEIPVSLGTRVAPGKRYTFEMTRQPAEIIRFEVDDNDAPPMDLNDGNWHHMARVRDPARRRDPRDWDPRSGGCRKQGDE